MNYTGAATTGNMAFFPLSALTGQPACPAAASATAAADGASTLESQAGPAASTPVSAELWLVGSGHLLITDGAGRRTGYVGGALLNEIPAATLLPVGGDLGIPAEPAYRLPLTATYSLLLDGQGLAAAGTAGVVQTGPGYVVAIEDLAVSAATQDRLSIAADGKRVSFRPSAGKAATLTLALDAPAAGYILQASSVDLGAGQPVTLTADLATGRLALDNSHAGAGVYDLRVVRRSAGGEQEFVHRAIAVAAGDTHYADFGAWNGRSLALAIDHGSDGTIDQVLSLTNQAGRLYLPLLRR